MKERYRYHHVHNKVNILLNVFHHVTQRVHTRTVNSSLVPRLPLFLARTLKRLGEPGNEAK